VASDPGEHGDQRRLIDVAEREMLRASEVIKSIAKITVPSRSSNMQYEIAQGDQIDPRPQGNAR